MRACHAAPTAAADSRRPAAGAAGHRRPAAGGVAVCPSTSTYELDPREPPRRPQLDRAASASAPGSTCGTDGRLPRLPAAGARWRGAGGAAATAASARGGGRSARRAARCIHPERDGPPWSPARLTARRHGSHRITMPARQRRGSAIRRAPRHRPDTVASTGPHAPDPRPRTTPRSSPGAPVARRDQDRARRRSSVSEPSG